MSGGDGSDVFHIHAGDGHDTIFDFRGHEDILDLRALGTPFTWAELSARFATADNGRDTVIDLSAWDGERSRSATSGRRTSAKTCSGCRTPEFPAGVLFEEVGFYVPGTTTFVGYPGAD